MIAGGFVAYSTYKNGWGWQGLLATMMGHNQETVNNLEEFKVLLLGVSTDIEAKLTDTIMVASYNPKTQHAALLSIPRDTFVGKSKTSASSYDKINALYQKGPEKTLKAVNEITGLDIKYYAVIDTKALIETVDAIGGVDFDVPIKMNYDDPTQDLAIHLEPGLQKIDGAKAEQLLRFRHNNNGTSYDSEYGDNDLGRMHTQRDFITETVKQTLSLKNVMKIGELMDIVYKNLETNIKLSEVKDYLPYAIEFDTSTIETGVVPGTTTMINKLSFFEYNKKETEALIQELFYSNEKTEETSKIESTATDIAKSQASQVNIEILNGSGNGNNLTDATAQLKKKGYNIYKTATTSNVSKTTIINNKGTAAEEVLTNLKDVLKTENLSSSAISGTEKADITIIIGKDYK